MSVLSCKNLSLGYEGREILSGLSFEVSAGSYLCVVGENGSGKTTLMKTIAGLQQPLGGSVTVPHSGIGYLPQQTDAQRDFPASVREVVLSGCQSGCGLRPFYSRAEKRLARENMEKTGVLELENMCYRELSGGQQQRVLLARALCATRELLLLDEPAAGLDPVAGAEMYRVTKRLNDDGVTIIMISHDIAAAVRYASHMLHIGDSVFFGSVGAYLQSDIGRAFAKGGDGGDQ